MEYVMDCKLTEEEMGRYTELLVNLPTEISLDKTIKSGMESGIPIEYFIQSGIINRDNGDKPEYADYIIHKIIADIEGGMDKLRYNIMLLKKYVAY